MELPNNLIDLHAYLLALADAAIAWLNRFGKREHKRGIDHLVCSDMWGPITLPASLFPQPYPSSLDSP